LAEVIDRCGGAGAVARQRREFLHSARSVARSPP
jgi:hypothetical protein